MPVRAADPAAQLIELRQAELVGAVDDDRVGVGKIEARLDDRRANQHLRLVVEKIDHDFFQFFGPHLAVGDGHLRFGNQVAELQRQPIDGFDPIVKKEYLPAALELAQNGIADHPLIVAGNVGLNRQAVHRRRFDDAQIADADHRHMQRARDRRRGQAEDVDQLAQLFQTFLVHHAEAVLFVDDHQPQIFELHVFLQQAMGADDDIHGALGGVLQAPARFL